MGRTYWADEVSASAFTVYGLPNTKGFTAVCHGASQHYSQRNAAARRPIESRVYAFWADMGIMRGNEARCILTGQWLPILDANGRRIGEPGTITLGHDVADSMGGAYCVCNLLPVELNANKAMGVRTFSAIGEMTFDISTGDLAYSDPRTELESWLRVNGRPCETKRFI